MKLTEQQIQEAAKLNFKSIADQYIFEAGAKWALEQDQWIPITGFDDFPLNDDFLVLFDTGEVRRFQEDWPFGIATHYMPLPNPPKR